MGLVYWYLVSCCEVICSHNKSLMSRANIPYFVFISIYNIYTIILSIEALKISLGQVLQCSYDLHQAGMSFTTYDTLASYHSFIRRIFRLVFRSLGQKELLFWGNWYSPVVLPGRTTRAISGLKPGNRNGSLMPTLPARTQKWLEITGPRIKRTHLPRDLVAHVGPFSIASKTASGGYGMAQVPALGPARNTSFGETRYIICFPPPVSKQRFEGSDAVQKQNFGFACAGECARRA